MVKRSKDIRRLLERRLNLWEEGQYNTLIVEAVKCDKTLKSNMSKLNDEADTVKIFSRLILRGKVREAVNWLLTSEKGGVLRPEDKIDPSGQTVNDVLKGKHPEPSLPDHTRFILPDEITEMPPLMQVDVTSDHVEKVARKLHGGGGPSGVAAEHWSDYLLRYGQASFRLRETIARLTMKLNNESVAWEDIQALMSSRLVALNKCPGVRPIGIGECLRRVLAKCMIEVTGGDVPEVCAELQLCSGLSGGIEGAIHGMNSLFQNRCQPGSRWGMLLVDANNAFNAINRQLALWQARIYWPRCARFLFNCYRGHAELRMRDSDIQLFSKEGVTQGDPLAMHLYALATLPIIKSLKTMTDVTQCWYADDSSAQGTFESLRSWWDILNEQGPAYGYLPQGQKSLIIVSENDKSEANHIFQGTGIKIETGARFLGGYIGSDKNKYVTEKVDKWLLDVEKLTNACNGSPQAAYTALTKAVQFKWSFLQRVVDGIDDAFLPLHSSLRDKFFPALFGGGVSTDEVDLFFLPVNKAGLAVSNPVSSAQLNFQISKEGNKVLSTSIIESSRVDIENHYNSLQEARKRCKIKKDSEHDNILNVTLAKFLPERRRAIERSVWSKMNAKSSTWLSVIPTKKFNFDLTPMEFRDALALRYYRSPVLMPKYCDGCGDKDFTIDHALCCKTGGLITRRHNEIRDLLGELCEHAWRNVVKEPIISEGDDGLRGDLACRGVWETQRESLFDIRVVDTDAPSYVSRPVLSVLKSAEQEKKRKYLDACERRHATFTPLVMSVDGVFAPQTTHFLNVLAERLADRWDRPRSIITGYLRARVTTAIIRASSMCIRGTRRKWKSASLLGFEDGAGVKMGHTC